MRRKWSANGPRDRRVNRGLRKLGGRVMRIWEHDLAKRGKASVRRIQATLQGRRWSWDGGLRAEDRRPEARAQCCLVIRHAYRGFHEEWIKRGELRLGLFATGVPWCKAMAEYAAVARPPLCGRTTNLKREVCLKRARPHPGPLPRGGRRSCRVWAKRWRRIGNGTGFHGQILRNILSLAPTTPSRVGRTALRSCFRGYRIRRSSVTSEPP